MAQNTPVEMVRHASTVSVLWGVLLIVFGMVAVASPFLAAVAVNALVAWLIILAGIVHLMVGFRTHGAGSMIWKILVGIAYVCVGGYAIAHPVLGVASLTLLLASLFLVEGVLDIILFVKMRPMQGSNWVLLDGIVSLLLGGDDLHAMAVEFGLGDWHAGRHQPDLQWRGASDDVFGGAQGYGCDLAAVVIVVGGLVGEAKLKATARSTSKATDRACLERSRRECPFHTTPGCARRTAERGCPYIYMEE